MKYLSFVRPDGSSSFGRLDGDTVFDLSDQHDEIDSLQAALKSNQLESLVNGAAYAFSELHLLPVIPKPEKILCVGVNYDNHRIETGREKVDYPTIFTRFADTLTAHNEPILRPEESIELDYEGELAIIIGKPGRRIREEHALEHIAGYSCFNDASIRDWQRHTQQFTPGKNFPTTGPLGPYLVTPDEAGELSEVHVTTRLNGQVLQDQRIGDMIFPIPALIAYISSFTTLRPGDVIATGTPGGVGARRNPPLWMKPGDRVEVEIGPMGVLANTIAQG